MVQSPSYKAVRNNDSFRDELSRAPVQDEDDAVFLAGLKERMDAIEAMRNCCAHNRRPSKKVEENYINAAPLLNQLLNGYLARWEWQEPEQEMLWDSQAREAVERAIELATWDEDNRTITLYDPDDERIRTEVTSRENLEQALGEIACTEFYANSPRDDGEFVFDCEDGDIVCSALEEHEERLEGFFDAEKSKSV